MYTELIEKLGELGFVVESDEKTSKVAKYDQYTGELLPEKIRPIKLEFNNCSITFKEDDFYTVWTHLSLLKSRHISKALGSLTVINAKNYAVQEIYDLAKLMLDKVQEGNKNETI